MSRTGKLYLIESTDCPGTYWDAVRRVFGSRERATRYTRGGDAMADAADLRESGIPCTLVFA